MIRQIFKMRTFLACVLAATTGMMLYFCYPFPDENFFLELIFLWARPVFQGLKFFYTLFLFTTPYILYSFLISATYIFTLKRDRKSTRLNSSHTVISYAVFCLKKQTSIYAIA